MRKKVFFLVYYSLYIEADSRPKTVSPPASISPADRRFSSSGPLAVPTLDPPAPASRRHRIRNLAVPRSLRGWLGRRAFSLVRGTSYRRKLEYLAFCELCPRKLLFCHHLLLRLLSCHHFYGTCFCGNDYHMMIGDRVFF